jgi:2'-5' RNA ligase
MDILNRSSLAIRLPADLQQAINEAQVQIRRKAGADLVRWTPSAEVVLTLTSLGEISPSQIAQVMSIATPIVARYAAPTITLESLGGSPTNLQPRFLWLGVTGDGGMLAQMTAELERSLGPVLPDHERREFPGHVPIGRLKQESEANRSALGRAVRVAGIGQLGSFRPAAVELLRASSTSIGPTLVTVQSMPFGG